jgi:hypothetical protein
MKTFVLAVLLLGGSAPSAAQWLDHPTRGIPRTPSGEPNLAAPAPRTADGKPDLSGLWTRTSRADAGGFKPLDPSVMELVDQRAENFFKEGAGAQCLPIGPGYLVASGPDLNFGMTKLIQTPALIVVLSPDLTYRQIFMDGRALETDPNPSFMGYSVGHWEGDTLVVESVGFKDRTWLSGGYPHTEALRTVERYQRRDFGHLAIEVELHDPALYAEPWKTTIQAELAADTELLEYVCNENQEFHEHWVGTRSDAERAEVALPADLLASYVGTYVEQQPFWQGAAVARKFEIRHADGALFLGQTRLVAQSETVFVNRGLAIEFVRDARGGPPYLWDKHVSGDYRFDRVQ